jgi:hypothetical protein
MPRKKLDAGERRRRRNQRYKKGTLNDLKLETIRTKARKYGISLSDKKGIAKNKAKLIRQIRKKRNAKRRY